MPTRRQLPPLNFIDTNPAMEAFQAGQKAHQQQLANDLAIEGQLVKNTEAIATAPTRLRRMQAEEKSATANADVDARTVGSRVATSQANARTAGANADVSAGTVGSRIAASNAAARTGGANAEVAEGTVGSRISASDAAARSAQTNADIVQQTAPYKVEDARSASRLSRVSADVKEATQGDEITKSRAGARQAEATALNTYMQGFYKSLEALNAGRIDEAQTIAKATGQEIPQVVIDNADVRAAVTAAAKYAQEAYPNRPRDQQAYIQGFIKDMADRRAQGARANDPTAVYSVQGAPTPQEEVIRTGAGGSRSSVFQQKQAAWLAVHPGDHQGALDYASGRRQLSEPEIARSALSLAASEIKNNTLLKYKSPAEQTAAIQQRAAEIAQQLRTGFAAPAAPTGAIQPPPGAGTREQPYQATTQDHVNWFKQSAPAGAVIIVNGTPYTK